MSIGSLIMDKAIATGAHFALNARLAGIARVDEVRVRTDEDTVRLRGEIEEISLPFEITLTGVNFDMQAFSFKGCKASHTFIEKAAMKLAGKTLVLS